MFTIAVSQMRISGSPSIMGDAKFSFPSTTAVFVSLLIAFSLLVCFRALTGLFTTVYNLSAVTDTEEKGSRQAATQDVNSRGYFGKSWDLFWKWEGLPLSLPISLSIRDEVAGVPVGKGVGVGLGAGAGVAPQMSQNWQQPRRLGPAFEHPLPAIYQSDVPVSMAKMIMSRHSIRRPAQRPPPKRSDPSRQQHVV